ncbi:hypothetical protein NIES22_66230 [Calothrix brevissima NIES-22]|nr:hypothetical protein NIES22_66230 [Calothrix brevissima NIES-22]
MKSFTIIYELVGGNREKDIKNLENEFKRIGAVQALYNSWVIKANEDDDPTEIIEYLKQKLIRQEDRVIVVDSAQTSWFNIDVLDTYMTSVMAS